MGVGKLDIGGNPAAESRSGMSLNLVAFFFYARRLTNSIPEVVELRSANITNGYALYFRYCRGV